MLGVVEAQQTNADVETSTQRQVDFNAQVLPILRTHCFECHAGPQAQGDLKLDSETAIARGGHSGSPIIGSGPDDSELVLRVTSESAGYRMPKEGDGLSKAEIDTLSRWVSQGGRWEAVANENKPSEVTADDRSFGQAWNWLAEQSQRRPVQYGGGALSLFLVLGIGWAWIRRATTDHRSKPSVTACVPWCVSAVAVVAGCWMYGQNLEAAEEVAKLRNDVQKLNGPAKTELIIDRSNLVTPPYPMHPKRLGGVYYRGNDERSDGLYNGGFYRTATMDIYLTDQAGNRLAWGDSLDPDQAHIEITIERAPLATRELFSDRVLNSIYLQHFSETDPSFDERLLFYEVEHEQKWKAVVPVSRWGSDRTQANGKIYLFYGGQKYGTQTGRVHFGIEYQFQLEEGKIQTQSELWMGSLYDLGGRVLVPSPDEVLLDRWFDFRPIPVIQENPSDDPELLGLPEHETYRPDASQ